MTERRIGFIKSAIDRALTDLNIAHSQSRAAESESLELFQCLSALVTAFENCPTRVRQAEIKAITRAKKAMLDWRLKRVVVVHKAGRP